MKNPRDRLHGAMMKTVNKAEPEGLSLRCNKYSDSHKGFEKCIWLVCTWGQDVMNSQRDCLHGAMMKLRNKAEPKGLPPWSNNEGHTRGLIMPIYSHDNLVTLAGC